MAIKTGESVVTVKDYLQNLRENKYKYPHWQRHAYVNCWPVEKVKSFHVRLAQIIDEQKNVFSMCPKLETPIYLFRLKNNPDLWINDGGNRSKAFQSFLSQNVQYREEDLRYICIAIQEWECIDDNDAYESYIRINSGTLMCAADMARGALTTKLNNYNNEWKPIFDNFGSEINVVFGSLDTKRKEKKCKVMQRDNYALIYRFLIQDKTLSSYNVGRKELKIGDSGLIQDLLKSTIEYKLAEIIRNYSCDKFKDSTISLIKSIQRGIALYKDIWIKLMKPGMCPNEEHIRWICHFHLYSTNLNIPVLHRQNFYEHLIKRSNGLSTIYPDDEQRKLFLCSKDQCRSHVSLALSDLSKTNDVCKIIRFDGSVLKRSDRLKNKELANGWDNSHSKSVILDPNGVSEPEPALRNRSRGSASKGSDIYSEYQEKFSTKLKVEDSSEP